MASDNGIRAALKRLRALPWQGIAIAWFIFLAATAVVVVAEPPQLITSIIFGGLGAVIGAQVILSVVAVSPALDSVPLNIPAGGPRSGKAELFQLAVELLEPSSREEADYRHLDPSIEHWLYEGLFHALIESDGVTVASVIEETLLHGRSPGYVISNMLAPAWARFEAMADDGQIDLGSMLSAESIVDRALVTLYRARLTHLPRAPSKGGSYIYNPEIMFAIANHPDVTIHELAEQLTRIVAVVEHQLGELHTQGLAEPGSHSDSWRLTETGEALIAPPASRKVVQPQGSASPRRDPGHT